MDGASSPRLAEIASLLASEARAAMMLELLDGRARTATELARAAHVSRPSASEHLHRLVQAGLIGEARQGRHRYVRIEDPAVAEIIESLAALSGRARPAEPSLRAQGVDRQLREARTCYRHLAGRLGVALSDGLREQGYVDDSWSMTGPGHAWITSLGIDLPARTRRPLTRPCLDWTERRDHLAGIVPDALLTAFRDKGWLEPGTVPRALRLTDAGRAGLGPVLASAPVPGRGMTLPAGSR